MPLIDNESPWHRVSFARCGVRFGHPRHPRKTPKVNSSMNYDDGVRGGIYSATQTFSNVLGGLMNFSALGLAGTASARASLCLAIGTLAVLGFMVSIGAVGFVALVFGVGILGLIGACGVLTLAVLVTVSVAAILITGSIFVPAGFFLVGGFFSMTLFSILIAIVDFLPGCALVAVAFLTLALITAFV